MTEETLSRLATPLTDGKANGAIATPEIVEPPLEPDPLTRRLLNPQTLLSFVIGLAILAFVLSRVDVNVAEIRGKLAQTNPLLFLAAMLLYYLTFLDSSAALAAAPRERRVRQGR